ncbi:MAG: bifunctional diaminohydroxyphosphoribosylaminopyrimidine deaminase/5-amino-6-(5-phosphoribosylamino)uracil reductase RibD [Bacteroidales bacterium]|nr:bifunctional diaminohydroxyphosphoribosylaminopyrimidine deaminase/5-amino-6-(5-phosphoribosylamino)uracil reductase RibD [Bacteroidales bacterium]
MTDDEKYMQRCIALAHQAFGNTYPNPMVGCVIVHDGQIIGEGFHHKAGEPHAEVNAIRSVTDQSLLAESTLYVCLEPCAHFGKTPPCADLIVSKHIKRVVVGCVDSFSKVSGKGIEKIRNAGIDVTINVLEKESRFLNRRFFTYHEKKRPYIILKWAQTADGFIDKVASEKNSPKGVRITDEVCQKLVHQWRAEEQAILVGTTTAVNDNPSLTTRLVAGKNPLRVVWDVHNKIPEYNNLKDKSTPTVIFTADSKESCENREYKTIINNLLSDTLEYLYEKGIQSVIVEGGTKTLQTFLDADMWDEARIFTTKECFTNGVSAPKISLENISKEETATIGNSTLQIIYRERCD